MGWVALIGGTLVAALALHYLYMRSCGEKRTSPVTRRGNHGSDTCQLEASKEIYDGKTSLSFATTSTPSFEVSAATLSLNSEQSPSTTSPSMDLHSKSGPALQSKGSMPPPLRSLSPPRLKPPTMSAPPRPSSGFVKPPPSAAASLRVPQTKVLSNASLAPSTLGVPKKKSSKQVMLKPGYSPLDWAMLTNDPKSNLRGKDAPDNMIKITPSQLKKQTGRKGKDAWTSYQGKVYNITAYLPFHPGGEPEIMKGAGRDSHKLFMENHPWVNWDGMLAECLVGMLVSESDAVQDSGTSGGLDEMD